jgi:hypothetical protein
MQLNQLTHAFDDIRLGREDLAVRVEHIKQ